jgi:hypothetical protein
MIGELDMHRINIRLGVNRNRFDVEFATGADDAKGDFATIGNQDAFEHDRSLREIGVKLLAKAGHLMRKRTSPN